MAEKLGFPSLKIVKASAGSGKTFYLTKTYVEYLLSDSIKFNDLKNILAITFSNNAALEIKERILKWLKDIYFNREDARSKFNTLTISEQELTEKSQSLIERILNNYSDFQVRTIDSFMTKIFKAEALNFGYPGDFEILMNPRNFLKRAFESYLSRFSESSPEGENLINLVETIEKNQREESSYLWNPGKRIFREIEEIERILSRNTGDSLDELELKIEENQKDFEKAKDLLRKTARKFENIVKSKNRRYNSRSNIQRVLEEIGKENYMAVFNTTFNKCPVISSDIDIEDAWESLKEAVALFVVQYNLCYLNPYLWFLFSFRNYLRELKSKEQKIFIDDINKFIGERLSQSLVPEIYYKLGDRIYHFFIDEFQDTSPLQWRNLKILVEESLSKGGSLLIVGDTKQAIYGFRGADYTIMKELIDEASSPSEFRSVDKYDIGVLDTNYRSSEIIIDFVRRFFKERLREDILNLRDREREKYGRFLLDQKGEPLVLSLSGLLECEQKVKEEFKKIGYVEIEKVLYGKDNEEETKREALLRAVDRLRNQFSFSYGEIAVLAFENSTLRQISTWLNEEGIDFLSFSSLDIRNRKIISELIYLLRFLDSPIDDFSLSIFLSGEVAKREFEKLIPDWKEQIEIFLFERGLKRAKSCCIEPYYKAFAERFPSLWEGYFAELIRRVGFLPLYDLLSEVFQRFRLFINFPEEEAALVKFLEICSLFERGLGEFIEFFNTSGDEDETFWDISKPKGRDAITLMTIHKAKGLEFPAVILFTDLEKPKTDRYFYQEGVLMRMPTEKVLTNPCLGGLAEIKNLQFNRAFTEELNKLYVALTRAKEALYILIPCMREEKGDSEICSITNEAVASLLGMDKTYGDSNSVRKLALKLAEIKSADAAEIKHRENDLKQEEDYKFSEESVDFYEIKRGEAIHRIISEIEYVETENFERLSDELESLVESTLSEFRLLNMKDEVTKAVVSVINNQSLRDYFQRKRGREVYTEKEVVDREGRLHRLDRVVVDEETVTVIEFKFGRNPDKDRAIRQTAEYVEILREIYPQREIIGLVYFGESKEVVKS